MRQDKLNPHCRAHTNKNYKDGLPMCCNSPGNKLHDLPKSAYVIRNSIHQEACVNTQLAKSGAGGYSTDLATSGLCLTASRRGSVLMRIAQQGKQASNRIRIPL